MIEPSNAPIVTPETAPRKPPTAAGSASSGGICRS